jgi:hypothetical protein
MKEEHQHLYRGKPSDESMAEKSMREEAQAIKVYDWRLERIKDPTLKKDTAHARDEEIEHHALFRNFLKKKKKML